jgi:hypothetical protein
VRAPSSSGVAPADQEEHSSVSSCCSYDIEYCQGPVGPHSVWLQGVLELSLSEKWIWLKSASTVRRSQHGYWVLSLKFVCVFVQATIRKGNVGIDILQKLQANANDNLSASKGGVADSLRHVFCGGFSIRVTGNRNISSLSTATNSALKRNETDKPETLIISESVTCTPTTPMASGTLLDPIFQSLMRPHQYQVAEQLVKRLLGYCHTDDDSENGEGNHSKRCKVGSTHTGAVLADEVGTGKVCDYLIINLFSLPVTNYIWMRVFFFRRL